jgi:hypothetical protein
MKSLTMNLMLAAAACMAASSVAMAADMKAEIPFAFKVAGKTMSPGTCNVRSLHAETQFYLANTRSGEGVFVNALGGDDPRKEWKAANAGVLQFACSECGCALAQLWTNEGYPAHYISNPKTRDDAKFTRVALIRAANSK